MSNLMVIKLGGSEGIDVERFLGDLARVERPYMLVHGANVELDGLMRRMGIEPRIVTSSTGQVSRFTDQETAGDRGGGCQPRPRLDQGPGDEGAAGQPVQGCMDSPGGKFRHADVRQ